MEAFALVKLKERPACCLVLPWLIGITLLHSGKDVNQLLSLSGFLDDLLDTIIFSEGTELTNEFDFNVVFISDVLGVRADLFRKRLGRSQYGSVNPAAVVGSGIVATMVSSTLTAVVFCKVMDGKRRM